MVPFTVTLCLFPEGPSLPPTVTENAVPDCTPLGTVIFSVVEPPFELMEPELRVAVIPDDSWLVSRVRATGLLVDPLAAASFAVIVTEPFDPALIVVLAGDAASVN